MDEYPGIFALPLLTPFQTTHPPQLTPLPLPETSLPLLPWRVLRISLSFTALLTPVSSHRSRPPYSLTAAPHSPLCHCRPKVTSMPLRLQKPPDFSLCPITIKSPQPHTPWDPSPSSPNTVAPSSSTTFTIPTLPPRKSKTLSTKLTPLKSLLPASPHGLATPGDAVDGLIYVMMYVVGIREL